MNLSIVELENGGKCMGFLIGLMIGGTVGFFIAAIIFTGSEEE